MEQRFEFELTPESRSYDEKTAQHILSLAGHIQDEEGERISEDRLAQIADEAGVKPEYLRAAIGVMGTRKVEEVAKTRVGLVSKARKKYEQTTGVARHIVNGALAGLVGGLGLGIFGAIELNSLSALCVVLSVLLGLWATFNSRSPGRGALTGMSWGAAFTVISGIFAEIEQRWASDGGDVVGGLVGGLFIGMIVGAIGSATVPRGEVQPTANDRQELLRQLYALQDKLSQGSRHGAFLSVDVVGSTGMKAGADPLAVEFTFGAYQRFAAETARTYGGQVHSTAGDGLILAFETSEKAYQASRLLQRNVQHLNAQSNRLAQPFSLRCGIHTGHVVTPTGDLRGVEFAHVIDLAAHLQKCAPPGGIVLSQEAVAGISDPVLRLGLRETVVEGRTAFVFPPTA